jgi:hypothetical protein
MTWLTRERVKAIRAAAERLYDIERIHLGGPSIQVVQVLADVFTSADLLDQELDYRERQEEPLPTPEEVEEMCRQHGLKELPF